MKDTKIDGFILARAQPGLNTDPTILRKDLHTEGPGRPVEYQSEWDLKDLMLRQLLQIPYMKDQVKRLKRNPYLRHACDYWNKAPTESSLLADEETDRG